ncbi:MAG: VWA domain-containing protein [Mariprofundaceae bacterium]|nr:VWA domain-containing protein [Mariprofundaceae bacterium]
MMDIGSDFHFLRPWAFLCLLLLFLMIYKLSKINQASESWKHIVAPELLAYLQVGSDGVHASKRPLWLLAIAGVLAVIALAGPVWEKLPQPMYRQSSALVIALDLSRSMDAADVKPSRLVRAKQKITDLLSLHKEGQSALIAFAGTAYVVTPLTEDKQTILSQLQGLTTDIMPKQGGDLNRVMEKALALFKQSSVKHGQLLLLTDSDGFSDSAVQKFTQAGHDVSVIGIGTSEGAPIPKSMGGFLTDRHGNIVIPSLHVSRLQDMAKLGHGIYRSLSLDNTDIQPVLARFNPTIDPQTIWQNKGEKEQSQAMHDAWREEGSWLLLLLIPLALLGFRRGLLLVALCVSLQTHPVEASIWNDMWQRPNSQGEALMAAEKYKQAAGVFKNPAWRLTANYRDKNYAAALHDFDAIKQPGIDDLYNKANVLAELGRLDEAIEAYEQVLKKSPEHQDAQANKALLEKMKKDQQAKDQQSKDQQSKDQQSKDQQSKEQQSKEQQSKEQQSKEQQIKENKLSEENIRNIEAKQAFEQTLRRVPDDPSGLLRRKFLYQYQKQHAGQSPQGGDAW